MVEEAIGGVGSDMRFFGLGIPSGPSLDATTRSSTEYPVPGTQYNFAQTETRRGKKMREMKDQIKTGECAGSRENRSFLRY
jgi:hypothetical protein